LLSVLLAAGLLVWAADEPKAKPATIRIGKPDGSVVEVAGLGADLLKELAKQKISAEQWALILSLRVEKNEAPGGEKPPAMLGTYRIDKDLLCFEPRFPLSPGVRYVAVLDYNSIPGVPDIRIPPVRTVLMLPKPKTEPAVVEQIYPTTDVLPENQLKFYLHFSAPMSRGEAYEHVRLLDEKGKEVFSPFLELTEELWDREYRCFTLFFDPGRIKRGLKPREELGPSLIEGKRYTLEIDRKWHDANGEPLKETYRRAFRVVAPDDNRVEPKDWKITRPTSGIRGPLVVTFPKPLDHGMLQYALWVAGSDGTKLPGSVKTDKNETRWEFTPEAVWIPGQYKLVADTRLADLAGNSIRRPFEIDVFHPIQKEIKTETIELPFTVSEK
jgi:hypothetical protein